MNNSIPCLLLVGALAACGGAKPQAGNEDLGVSDDAAASGSHDLAGSTPDFAPIGDGGAVACDVTPVKLDQSTPYTAQTVVTQTLSLSKYPDALCNDGTPALFEARPGYGSGKNRWLISLEGGGSCYDQTTCAARYASTTATGKILTTSSMGMESIDANGILSPDPTVNPDFYDANIVRVHYCTSDSWQGTHDSSGTFSGNDPSTWNFHGHAIVHDIIEEALANGMASATEIILEGESAGGEGVLTNANAVRQQLPADVRFVAISDAAFAVNVPGYDPTAPNSVSTAAPPYPLEMKYEIAIPLWQGTGDTVCAAAHPGDLDCSLGQSLLDMRVFPFPVFIRQSEEDEEKFHDVNAPDPTTPAGMTAAAQAYYTYYEAQQRAAMQALPAPYSGFAPDITDHITLLGGPSGGPYTYDTPIFTFPGGVTSSTQQAVSAFYADPCTQRLLVQ